MGYSWFSVAHTCAERILSNYFPAQPNPLKAQFWCLFTHTNNTLRFCWHSWTVRNRVCTSCAGLLMPLGQILCGFSTLLQSTYVRLNRGWITYTVTIKPPKTCGCVNVMGLSRMSTQKFSLFAIKELRWYLLQFVCTAHHIPMCTYNWYFILATTITKAFLPLQLHVNAKLQCQINFLPRCSVCLSWNR